MKTAKYLAAEKRTAAKIEEYKQAKTAERQAWELYRASEIPCLTSPRQVWDKHIAAYRNWEAAYKRTNIIGGFVKQMVSRLRSLRFTTEEKPRYIKRDYPIPEIAISDFEFLATL